MPALAAQPFGAATAAPAREPGNATLGPARADEALSRTATSLLHAQQFAGDMIADADQRTARSAAPQTREGPEVHGLGPQDSRTAFDNDAQPGARSAQTRNADDTCPISGEVLCGQ
jgi:hypothetical protein